MTDRTAPIIETLSGAVRGERAGEIEVFRGIPFAAPPVGPLRWRPPQPVAPWEGIRDCTRFGDDCPQRSVIQLGSRAPGQSEDCLTLNIWRPVGEPDAPLPVMVWIFGGSFVYGSAAEDRADGTSFARDGVIHVTLNYRVGLFGFLAHPGLTAESPDDFSGNYGLLDQIAGLRWVQDNIARFGGDPDRVTAFGVSAGAASISLLLTSPIARGLFSQAILQSPGAFRPLATLQDAEAAGGRLGDDIAALRELSVDDLLDRQKLLEPAMRSLTGARVLRPIRDGHVIVEDDRDAFLSGRFAHVPLIVGSMTDEGSAAVAKWPIDTQDAFAELLETTFGDAGPDAAALYPVENDNDARPALGQLFGDTQFTYGTAALARAFAAAGLPVFRYVFTRRRPGKPDPRHSEDVGYVFDRADLAPRGDDNHRYDQVDVALAGAMHAAWASFAKSGKPIVAGLPWPKYDDAGTMVEFGNEIRVRAGWRQPHMAFLDRFQSRADPAR
ncbi:carboxylesterase/lipase family protein [Hephaestia mangrovi]|uniref:carboxylesterase/lipase family protein n=1 Tax=Hephaestia mangrovi TaxID=2873268 RepID=UPI001CA6A1B3|nr:carboxylesterase family protein [Hephaestia mangrovi]